ncbi:hypothetical protein FRC08_018819 [Ceratobasidium sp. 394]|nr:hypothetical protein FRC08_018819 [Ceratobasidium sp. 394]
MPSHTEGQTKANPPIPHPPIPNTPIFFPWPHDPSTAQHALEHPTSISVKSKKQTCHHPTNRARSQFIRHNTPATINPPDPPYALRLRTQARCKAVTKNPVPLIYTKGKRRDRFDLAFSDSKVHAPPWAMRVP